MQWFFYDMCTLAWIPLEGRISPEIILHHLSMDFSSNSFKDSYQIVLEVHQVFLKLFLPVFLQKFLQSFLQNFIWDSKVLSGVSTEIGQEVFIKFPRDYFLYSSLDSFLNFFRYISRGFFSILRISLGISAGFLKSSCKDFFCSSNFSLKTLQKFLQDLLQQFFENFFRDPCSNSF